MQAVIYCRVSTKEQVDNLSLPTQQRECEAYCRREGWDVASVFVEQGESAKTADRTELKLPLAFCREHKKHVRVVVVYNLSRFSRNTGDHHVLRAALASCGIVIKSATEPLDDSPTGRFMETIFSAVAQLDNDVKADRTRAGMKAALELGRWTWQPPFGYSRGDRGGPSMVPHQDHAPAVLAAFIDFANGAEKNDVLRRLKAHGASDRGTPRTLKALDRMLRNALFAGRVEVPKWGVSRAGDFEPIVPEAVFDRAQSRFASSVRRRAPRTTEHPDFPLRRFIRCAACEGQAMTGGWSRGRSGRYAYYECPRCRRGVAKAELEGAFVDLLKRLQPRPEYMRLFKVIVLDVWKRREAGAREERAKRERQVATLREKLDRLADALTDGAIDPETYKRQNVRLRGRIGAAESDFAEAWIEHLDVDAVLAFAEHMLTNASRLWEQASVDHKRKLQSAYFPDGLSWEPAVRSNRSRRGAPAGSLRTAATSNAFSELSAIADAERRLASPTGFEPVSPP